MAAKTNRDFRHTHQSSAAQQFPPIKEAEYQNQSPRYQAPINRATKTDDQNPNPAHSKPP